tara:strand:- start:2391 stop:3419 length:1029 start_codon:yes stop_codon:yes gene_type:complete
MRVLSKTFPSALHHIISGWKNVFTSIGWDWAWWDGTKPIFDCFDEFKPDIFIGTTYDLDRATAKCLAINNTKAVLKANNWGPYDDIIDIKKYPIGIADQKEKESAYKLSQLIGDRLSLFNFYHPKRIHDTMLSWIDSGINVIPMQPAADHFVYYPDYPDEKLECDISFVGGYWSYKGQNLSKYLFPLTNPVGKYRMKVFGTGWGIPQYCGVTDDDTVRKLFCSSKICPNVSEPHANKFGFEVNERVFKISACKSFCISDHIDSLVEDVFTKNEMPVARDENEFIKMIEYFIDSPNLRKSHAEACYETVMKEHTYCHRINSLLRHLQYKEEAEKCLEILNGNK